MAFHLNLNLNHSQLLKKLKNWQKEEKVQEAISIIFPFSFLPWQGYKAYRINSESFPSTPDEAFEVSNEGLYYGRQIVEARQQGEFVEFILMRMCRFTLVRI